MTALRLRVLPWAVLALLAAVSLALAGARGAAGSKGTTGAMVATGATGATTPPGARVLYRPIGCVRSGALVAYRGGPPRKVVALSFDDGPSEYTPAFVRMLAAQHVPATFFMIGRQVTAAFRATLRRELRDGDALGDHTFTHPDLLRSAGVSSQLQKTLQAIRGLTGYTPCVFRPPYGDYDQSVITTAASLGLATILWDVDPSDWALPGVPAIERRVLAEVAPGSIILSHDGGGPREQTLAAYPLIISELKRRGYRFETVPQLLGFKTEYVRCPTNCKSEGVPAPLPAGSIVVKGASTPVAHSEEAPAASATPACTTAGLDVWLNNEGGGGAAGSVYYKLEFTNLSGRRCRLGGYPGVSPAGLSGRRVGAPARREALASPPATLTLNNGASASAVLRITDAGNFPPSACRALTAAGLMVYPPGQAQARFVPFPFQACALSGPAVLSVRALQAG